MAMGRRPRERQEALFIASEGLGQSPGHPFYRKLNELLAEAGFDRWIEGRCQRYYATEEKRGPKVQISIGMPTIRICIWAGISTLIPIWDGSSKCVVKPIYGRWTP